MHSSRVPYMLRAYTILARTSIQGPTTIDCSLWLGERMEIREHNDSLMEVDVGVAVPMPSYPAAGPNYQTNHVYSGPVLVPPSGPPESSEASKTNNDNHLSASGAAAGGSEQGSCDAGSYGSFPLVDHLGPSALQDSSPFQEDWEQAFYDAFGFYI